MIILINVNIKHQLTGVLAKKTMCAILVLVIVSVKKYAELESS